MFVLPGTTVLLYSSLLRASLGITWSEKKILGRTLDTQLKPSPGCGCNLSEVQFNSILRNLVFTHFTERKGGEGKERG